MKKPYREQLAILDIFQIKHTGSKWGQRKGQDSDTDCYDVFDQTGTLIGKYEIVESTSIYPPHPITVSFTEITPEGTHVRSGSLRHASE